METLIAQYKGTQISFLQLPDNGLLLKTKDILKVLGIPERSVGIALRKPCLNLYDAFSLARSHDPEFASWLDQTFAKYELTTLVVPECGEEWHFK
jgi:hypothetical protein